MRCPSCGTENTPDSRFCGGCGAKMASGRVAPTAKLSDDARYPSNPGYLPTPVPGYMPTPAPGSLMQAAAPSMPPPAASLTPTATLAPAAPSPSLSMPAVAKRNGTLIAAVVILDLGLAGAGAVLLAKGLDRPGAPPPADPPRPAPAAAPLPTEAPAPAPAPAAVDAGVGSAVAPAAAVPAGSARAAVEPAGPDRKGHTRRSGHLAGAKAGPAASLDPQDPYGDEPARPPAASDPGLASQIDHQAQVTAGLLAMCANNAGAVHGRIQVAFRVYPDGRVGNVAAVENTTGSDPLARCLVNTIAGWSLPPRTGDPVDFVRPFSYP